VFAVNYFSIREDRDYIKGFSFDSALLIAPRNRSCGFSALRDERVLRARFISRENLGIARRAVDFPDAVFPELARVKYYANTLEFPLEKFPSTASIDKQRRYPSACLASRSGGRKRKRSRFPLTVEEKITPRDIGSISGVIS
jgi:hypothetical protein